jgi:hypothetical protein
MYFYRSLVIISGVVSSNHVLWHFGSATTADSPLSECNIEAWHKTLNTVVYSVSPLMRFELDEFQLFDISHETPQSRSNKAQIALRIDKMNEDVRCGDLLAAIKRRRHEVPYALSWYHSHAISYIRRGRIYPLSMTTAHDGRCVDEDLLDDDEFSVIQSPYGEMTRLECKLTRNDFVFFNLYRPVGPSVPCLAAVKRERLGILCDSLAEYANELVGALNLSVGRRHAAKEGRRPPRNTAHGY